MLSGWYGKIGEFVCKSKMFFWKLEMWEYSGQTAFMVKV